MLMHGCHCLSRMGREIQTMNNDWIPCGERLPENLEVVNITWCNRKPEPCYTDIKDVPFTATAVFFDKRWFWYSVCCEDYLSEYGDSPVDKVDDCIEILAWMPLPEPYRGE